MSWDDDVTLGESLRGSQDSHMGGNTEIGAARRQLGSQLQALAAGRFGKHAPMQKELRSPYKDSTQLGVLIKGDVTPEQYPSVDAPLPQLSGSSRVFQSFKPEKVIVTELLIATYTNASDVSVRVAASVSDASDVVLIQLYSGNYNCFPNAPDASTGISGAAFAYNALGNGISWPTINPGIDVSAMISWPTINPGIDVSATIGVEESVLYRFVPPDGYDAANLVSVRVRVRINLFGPQLR